jgi:hypothetical protein
VHSTAGYKRRDVAAKVLEILSGLTSQELAHNLKRLDDLKQRTTAAFFRVKAASYESEITKLKTFIAGLNSHKQAICDFLIYRAANTAVHDEPWTWRVGEAIPKLPRNSSEASSSPLPEESFSIPSAYLCPISQEVMDDPVITCDGFTFDRNNIER